MSAPLWRRLLVGAAGVAGGAALLTGAKGSDRELALPALALVVAAVVIHLPSLGAQLLARAIWWANLGLGAIVCILSGSSVAMPGLALVAACGFALLAAGRQSLGDAGERGGYAPAAFRSSLLLLMVLALADAQSFLLFIVLVHENAHAVATGLVLGPAVVAYMIGFVGLYRLAPWGAVLNAFTSVVVFLVVLSRVTEMNDQLRHVVLVLTAVHAVAAAPMLFSLFTGRALPQASARVRALLGSGVVLAVVAVSALSAFGVLRIR